ncbi:MAG: hypothetical protein PVH55_10000 [Desulfobacterales bacterium]|jgi:hypothetical protein
MVPVEKKFKEIDAYDEKELIEDLTINDALILIAVCAAKEQDAPDVDQNENVDRITALAEDHPLFSDLLGSIKPSLNKYMNMIRFADMVKYVAAAAKVLKPDLKETAFTWAAIILMPDGVLTEARKNIMDRYAMLLDIDIKTAQRILVQVS